MASAVPDNQSPVNGADDHRTRPFPWIARAPTWVPTLALALASLMGCAAEASDSAVEARVITDRSNPTIFGGLTDDDVEAAAGVVALRVGTGSAFELCSGALIAPNVILTARHCVTKKLSNLVSCDENGRSASGPHVSGDQDPSSIGVFLGAHPSFGGKPVSIARAIVAPRGANLCDSDIALIVLTTPVMGVAPLAVRIHSPARAGEMIRSVGYGQTDSAAPLGTRFRRAGVAVLAQGNAVSPSNTPLGAHEFEVGTSICRGDSGGPAISEATGAVIGVVSRGGGCAEDFGHVYTTTAGFTGLFDEAFDLANASPTMEQSDINVSTPSPAPSSTEADASASPASCSLRPAGNLGGGVGTVSLALVVAALAALGVRRRRESLVSFAPVSPVTDVDDERHVQLER